MYYVTIKVMCDGVEGQTSAVARNQKVVDVLIDAVKEVCARLYKEWEIISIEKKIIDEEGNMHEIH